jgi:epoxide hydrolase-like predicted phosphatase
MIKAIIFDLGGVLFTDGTKKFIDEIGAQYNLDKEKVKEVMDGEIGSFYRVGKISRDQFWKEFLTKLHLEADIDELENKWIGGYELIEGTRDVILELGQKYKVLFLSDNVKERVDAINQKYGFLAWFEGGVFSHEAGVRKPDSKIYQLALEKAGVEPEEAVFVDDKAPFLEPAVQMGMTTFLFETPGSLREKFINARIL